MRIGDKIKCINTDGIQLEVGKVYTIREIGDRTGGLRLDGVYLFHDLTGYEKCYGGNRFVAIDNGGDI